MKIRYAIWLSLAATLSFDWAGAAHVLEYPREYQASRHEPHTVVELYLKAIDRGELVLFEQVLERAMLTPSHVEYVYDLNSPVPTVKVYSILAEPLPVPGHEAYEIRGITSTLNAQGAIVETRAHVTAK